MTTNTEIPKISTALDAPTITFPEEGKYFDSGTFDMKGRAEPGAVVRLYSQYDHLNPIFGQLTGNDGEWRHRVTFTKGEHLVYAIQCKTDNSECSPASPIRTFHVRS
jgi:hypothetical protein